MALVKQETVHQSFARQVVNLIEKGVIRQRPLRKTVSSDGITYITPATVQVNINGVWVNIKGE